MVGQFAMNLDSFTLALNIIYSVTVDLVVVINISCSQARSDLCAGPQAHPPDHIICDVFLIHLMGHKSPAGLAD